MYMYHCIYVHVHVYINYMYMYNCIAEVRVLLLAMCQSDYFLQLFY